MNTSLDCIPCFIRQALEAARFTSDNPTLHEAVVRRVLDAAAKIDLMQSPPVVSRWIHRQLREITGCRDPYHSVKERFNRAALALLPELSMKVGVSQDPLTSAVRLAIAGNAIDLGPENAVALEDLRQTIFQTFSEPLYGNLEGFRRSVAAAGCILYLADNAGEIVFDRLLIERLPMERITLAVRGHPVINDATMADAEAAGLHRLVTVIDNGSDAPGTMLDDCSTEFREVFEKADIIIAKGQGNYETLSDVPEKMFFLLKVKCPVIASRVALNTGAHAILPSGF
ncbi:damage-control phosphatase ARMT1 family protein [Syntrophorhabdus aromaticivorans]|uniref:damage-control phosphatase ARMT1 family protein n=1 Tax=Syntrophorhabdus aromaticivorans TaxID=328301 RepID=UPI00040B1077|nr:ARMT1-like domain-containing protein [Syntrophorhabdus aromaticivorans]HBA55260.1 DUF89 domain-containing protein [Syntrophorhabdus aromaticivorans]